MSGPKFMTRSSRTSITIATAMVIATDIAGVKSLTVTIETFGCVVVMSQAPTRDGINLPKINWDNCCKVV